MTEPTGHTPAYPIQYPPQGGEQFTLQQMAPKRRSNGRLYVAIALVTVVILAGAGVVWLGLRGSGPSTPAGRSAFTISGQLDLTSASIGHDSTSCWGTDGYDDIRRGADVTVTDPSGKVVALGALGSGTIVGSYVECVFSFTVANVPAGLGFYGIEVSHRGVLRYSESDVTRGLTLTVG